MTDMDRLRELLAPLLKSVDAYDPEQWEIDEGIERSALPPSEELFDVTFDLQAARDVRDVLRGKDG